MGLFTRRPSIAPDLGRGVEGGGVLTDQEHDAGEASAEEGRALPLVDGDLASEVAEAVRESGVRLSRAEKRALRQQAKADGPGVGSRKAARDTAKAAADDHRLSNKVMIEFYPGLTKEDAIQSARHWAMAHMEMPSLCFYYVQKIQGGFAVEVQEGVGKAYLPSVIDLASANPGRIVVVPMVRRKMMVVYSARMGEFEAQVLPEQQEPPAMPENPPIVAPRSVVMTPVMKQYQDWLYAGVGTALIGGLALLSSLGFYALDSRSKVPPEWHTTDVGQLPILQWSRLQPGATDSYVVRLEYQDGQWRIVRQAAAGSSVDVATPVTTAPSGPTDGSVAAAPGSAPAVNTPQAQIPAASAPTIPPPVGQ